MNDVTENLTQRQQLAHSRDQLERAQELAKIGSWEIGIDGRVELSKQMQLILGLNEQHVHLGTFAKKLLPEDPSMLKTLVRKSSESREDKRFEHIGVSLSSPVQLFTAIMASGSKDHVLAKGISLDISRHKQIQDALKRSNEELVRINEELDRFTYIVSHDLKSPVRAMYNLAAFIEEDVGQDDLNKENILPSIKLLQDRARFMEQMIEGILNYSRAGRKHYAYERVDIKGLVRSLIDGYSAEHSIELSFHGKWPEVLTEEIPIVQIFSNLIGNAVKYGDKDILKLKLFSELKGDHILFKVEDNGPGIPKSQQEKVFGLFQTMGEGKGTGVGLALVKRIIEERGGYIQLESDGKNGSSFRFLWPLKKSET